MAAPSLSRTSADSAVLDWCCILYAGGIIGTLLLYGLLQERIMSVPYDGEYFKVSVFLVFCNRLVAIAFCATMIWLKGESFRLAAPFWRYMAISFSLVAASACQYEALKYVAFTVQMLGKSFKMMPVMLWSMAISGKRYTVVDWLIAVFVTLGVVQFLVGGNIAPKHNSGDSTFGLLLLGVFLAFDGFSSTFQEKLFKEFETSKYNQMLYVNLGSAVVSLGSLLAMNKFGSTVSFCWLHPDLMLDIVVLSSAAVSAQWFIYSQVKEFGALIFAATMNVRQVASILISNAAYGHSITMLQGIGFLFVFAALFYKNYVSLAISLKASCTEKWNTGKSEEGDPLLAKETGTKDISAPERTGATP